MGSAPGVAASVALKQGGLTGQAILQLEVTLEDSKPEKVAFHTLPKPQVFALALVTIGLGESGAILGLVWTRRRFQAYNGKVS